jgi:hypothetical protein
MLRKKLRRSMATPIVDQLIAAGGSSPLPESEEEPVVGVALRLPKSLDDRIQLLINDMIPPGSRHRFIVEAISAKLDHHDYLKRRKRLMKRKRRPVR